MLSDLERQGLLIRLEALIHKIDFKSEIGFQAELLATIDKLVGSFMSSMDMTDLQRRRAAASIAVEMLTPAFKTLGEDILKEMNLISGYTNLLVSGMYLENPIDKVYRFQSDTLIQGYELKDLLHSNHRDSVKKFKLEIAKGIAEGRTAVQVQR